MHVVGRPRIHPQPVPPPKPKPVLATPASLLQQPSSEVLDIAIQSILPSSSTTPSPTIPELSSPIKNPTEIITYEVLPNMDLRPIQSAATVTSNIIAAKAIQHQQQRVYPVHQQKVKTLPPNQFVKIKPPTMNQKSVYALNNSKFTKSPTTTYTVRTQMKPGPTATTSTEGGKVFTLKSSPTGTQLLSTTPNSSVATKKATIIAPTNSKHMALAKNTSVVINPQKFTIMKSGSPVATSTATSVPTPQIVKLTSSKSDLTNIFDIPILFADNDGNIQDNSVGSASTSITPSPIQLHGSVTLAGGQAVQVSSNPLHGRNIIINSIATSKSNPNNKVVFINRGALKGQTIQVNSSGMGGSSGTSATTTSTNNVPALVKYTKVNVSNASSISLPVRNTTTIGPTGAIGNTQIGGRTMIIQPTGVNIIGGKSSSFVLGSKVELLNNSIIKASPNSGGNKVELLSSSIIRPASTSIVSTGTGKYQPIVINLDSDKTTVKNLIKVDGTTSGGNSNLKTNTIVIKPGGLKPIPMIKPGILNRNVTVRKVVNIFQQKPTTETVASSSETPSKLQ